MWVLTLLYVLLSLCLGWMLFVHLQVLWFVGAFRTKKEPAFPSEWPRLSIVVPCFNEEREILDKLEDVRKLDYPLERMEVVFADGGSKDSTVELLRNAVGAEEPYRVVECPESGKINQINHVLPGLDGDIFINTDVDARLARDALKWIAAEFNTSPEAWVVGAYCRPDSGIPFELHHWQTHNKGRFLESDAGAASIVIAQCYAFRRGLLRAFPRDVIADDIYVAFLASTLGHRTIYSRKATAVETRGPRNVGEFLSHKLRKSHAYLRETLRFAYRLPEMTTLFKVMLLTQIGQQLLLPWVMIFWMLTAGALLTLYRLDLVILGVAFLIVLLFISRAIFQSVKLPDDQKYSIKVLLGGYLLANLILLTTALTYPFLHQDSSYARLASGRDRDTARGSAAEARGAEKGADA